MSLCGHCPTPGACYNSAECLLPRPATGLDAAIREAQDAIAALEAAARRLNEATANVAAALAIHKSQQGPL